MTKSKSKFSKFLLDYNIVLILVVIFIAACVVTPKFYKLANFISLSQSIGTSGILAIGMTFIFLVSGIDLSIAYQVAVSGTLMAIVISHNLGVGTGFATALLCGALLGYINGTIVTRMQIPSLIGTLAVMTSLEGVTLLINGNSGISVKEFMIFGMSPDKFYNYKILGVLTPPLLICIVMLVVLALFLRNTRSGVNIYIVGGNAEAGKFSGINNDRLTRFAYTMGGLCAGICAALSVCRMNASTYNMGDDLDIIAICSVVVGGVKMSGGKGGMGTCIMGVAVIQIIKNVMIKLGYQSSLQSLVTGVVLILVLILDRFTSKKSKADAR